MFSFPAVATVAFMASVSLVMFVVLLVTAVTAVTRSTSTALVVMFMTIPLSVSVFAISSVPISVSALMNMILTIVVNLIPDEVASDSTADRT
jgi:hypothetical protein